MELGLYTFADVSPAPGPGAIGAASAPAQPHRGDRRLPTRSGSTSSASASITGPDYAASAPVVALAAAAERTKRIKLTSAVTVLSSDDPVRVFQQFSTLDLLSSRPRRDHGRARLLHRILPAVRLRSRRLRRAVCRKARPAAEAARQREGHLVGQAARRRSTIAASIRAPTRTGCRSGSRSAARRNRSCAPARSACRWRSPSSAASRRASRRCSTSTGEAASQAGHDPKTLATSLNVHGFVGETTEQAADDFYGPQAEVMNRIGRERGWGPTIAGAFRPVARSRRGALFVGNPEAGRRKDRRPAQDLRQRPLPAADGDRHHAARQDHEGDRTLRHQGRADRAQGDGEGQ